MYENPYHEGSISGYSFLITGGAGFIGSHIAEYLLMHNAGRVVVLDNLATGRRSNIEPFLTFPNFEFIDGSICDPLDCARAMKGIDYVSHQAALGSVPRSLAHPDQTNHVNVSGYLNILIAAKKERVKRIVYASSSSVYGDSPDLPKVEEKIGKPMSPYAVSKYTNELYAEVFYTQFGLELIGLRYFNVFGPRQDPNGAYAAVIPLFIKHMMENKPVYVDGDGNQTRDFTFVANAVQANIKALLTQHPEAVHKIMNVAVGKNFSVNEMFEGIKQLLNSQSEKVHREARKGDVRNSLADITKARTYLSYDPIFSFQDGLALTVAYFKEHHHENN